MKEEKRKKGHQKIINVNYHNKCGRMKLHIKGKNATGNALKVMNASRKACNEEDK